MTRNVGNEVIVALAAVAMIALVIAFGVLLSISEPDEDTAATTQVVDSNVGQPSVTPVPPTPIITLPGNEVTATATTTGLRSPTLRSGQSAAPGETPTPSDDVSTVASMPTQTMTPQPSDTATATITASMTSTATGTPTPTATLTPTVTATIRATITPTATPTATPAATTTGVSCVVPNGWERYVVQPGNTLFSIARSVGSSVSVLQRVNCLVNPDRLRTGDVLYVPRLPAAPVETGVPSAHGTQTGDSVPPFVGCINLSARITSPGPGQRVRGHIAILGTATLENFAYYKLEVRPDAQSTWNFWSRSDNPVASGQLGRVDTAVFGRGLHWVRLAVVDNTGNVPPSLTCAIPLIFE